MNARTKLLYAVVPMLGSVALAQGPIKDYAPSPYTMVRDIPYGAGLGGSATVEVGEVTGNLYADVVTLSGSQMSLLRDVGRYEFRSSFGSPSNAFTILPTGKVLSAESGGLATYSWSSSTFALSVRTAISSGSGPSWANADKLTALKLGTNTYVAARQALNYVLIGRLNSSNQIVGGVQVPISWTVSKICILDWNADGSPEIAVAGTGGLKLLTVTGALIHAQGGDISAGNIARLARSGGDRLIMAAYQPIAGLSALTVVGSPPGGVGLPTAEPYCWLPFQYASDMVVVDYNMDGALDVIFADASASQPAKQAWVAHQRTGLPPPGESSFFLDMSANANINHFVIEPTASSTAIRLAAGDYESDGDPDLVCLFDDSTNGATAELKLLPSATIDAQSKRVSVPRPALGFILVANARETEITTNPIRLPASLNTGFTANTLQIIIWCQDQSGVVDPVPKRTYEVSLTPTAMSTLLTNPLTIPKFSVPNVAGQTLQIQYTLIQRSAQGQLVSSGPPLTGYYAYDTEFHGSGWPEPANPDQLPETQPPGSSVRPPSYPPRP